MTRDQEYTILPVRPRRNWLALTLVGLVLVLQLATIAILTFNRCNDPVVVPTPTATTAPVTTRPTTPSTSPTFPTPPTSPVTVAPSTTGPLAGN